MARVTIQDCLDKVPNHFELVLVASAVAKELLQGKAPAIETENSTVAVVALREIAEDVVDLDKIRSNLYSTISNNSSIHNYTNVDTEQEEDNVLDIRETSDLLIVEDSDNDELLSNKS